MYIENRLNGHIKNSLQQQFKARPPRPQKPTQNTQNKAQGHMITTNKQNLREFRLDSCTLLLTPYRDI